MDYQTFVEIFGIIASLIILISLLMRSLKKLRFISMIGSISMFTYGLLIGALPVMIMNVGIFIINVYYIAQMLKTNDYFDVISVEKTDEYLLTFIDFYHEKISTAMQLKTLENSDFRIFILRNMVPAGLFIAKRKNDKTLEIILDFVTPAYKDFKTGKYVFTEMADKFREQGYEQFITDTKNFNHMRYLKRMDFKAITKEDDRVIFTKSV